MYRTFTNSKLFCCLSYGGIPFNYVNIEKYILFNLYCATQEESKKVKKLLDAYDAKYFVTESKNL